MRFHFGHPIEYMKPPSFSCKALTFDLNFAKTIGLSRELALDSVASKGCGLFHFSSTYSLQFIANCCAQNVVKPRPHFLASFVE